MTQPHKAHIDQVPPYQNNSNLEPAYNGSPFVADKEIDTKKRTKFAVYVGGAAVVAAAVFGGWMAKSFTSESSNILDKAGNQNSDTPFPGSYDAAPPTITIEGETIQNEILTKEEIQALDPAEYPEAVKSVDAKSLLSAYGSDLDSWRLDTFNYMKEHFLNAEQEKVLSMPPSGDKILYSNQDVINSVSIDLADASIQKIPEEGQRILPLIVNKNCPGFETYFNSVHQEGITININKDLGEQIPKPTETFMGHDISNASDARIIKWENLPTEGQEVDYEYQRYALYVLNEHDGESSWQLVDKWSTDRQDINNAIRSLNQ